MTRPRKHHHLGWLEGKGDGMYEVPWKTMALRRDGMGPHRTDNVELSSSMVVSHDTLFPLPCWSTVATVPRSILCCSSVRLSVGQQL